MRPALQHPSHHEPRLLVTQSQSTASATCVLLTPASPRLSPSAINTGTASLVQNLFTRTSFPLRVHSLLPMPSRTTTRSCGRGQVRGHMGRVHGVIAPGSLPGRRRATTNAAGLVRQTRDGQSVGRFRIRWDEDHRPGGWIYAEDQRRHVTGLEPAGSSTILADEMPSPSQRLLRFYALIRHEQPSIRQPIDIRHDVELAYIFGALPNITNGALGRGFRCRPKIGRVERGLACTSPVEHEIIDRVACPEDGRHGVLPERRHDEAGESRDRFVLLVRERSKETLFDHLPWYAPHVQPRAAFSSVANPRNEQCRIIH
ncbi:MAG: hypothetical protein AVDCRST_MAG89-4257, partial [uncultured Gemmatimonadetes bacterium]